MMYGVVKIREARTTPTRVAVRFALFMTTVSGTSRVTSGTIWTIRIATTKGLRPRKLKRATPRAASRPTVRLMITEPSVMYTVFSRLRPKFWSPIAEENDEKSQCEGQNVGGADMTALS